MRHLELAVDALATFRLTRLVVADVLTAEARDAIVEGAYASAGRRERAVAEWLPEGEAVGRWAEAVANDPDPPKLATLVTCPWCTGMYLAAGVALARRVAPRPWSALAKVLALSAAAGIIASAIE